MMPTMPGWLSFAVEIASWRKRRRALVDSERSSERILSAMSRPSLSSCARQTVAIPPRPSGAMMRKRPMCVPIKPVPVTWAGENARPRRTLAVRHGHPTLPTVRPGDFLSREQEKGYACHRARSTGFAAGNRRESSRGHGTATIAGSRRAPIALARRSFNLPAGHLPLEHPLGGRDDVLGPQAEGVHQLRRLAGLAEAIHHRHELHRHRVGAHDHLGDRAAEPAVHLVFLGGPRPPGL